MIRFSHGAATSVGRVRRVNEDSYLAVPPIYAVADGMGGHGSGDVASRLAIEALARCVELRPLFTEAVLHALEEANQVIVSRAEPPSRMGTTVTGLAGLETNGGDHLMVFNVGDSRVYRLAGDRIVQLTVDHSEVQEMVLAGVLTRDQARTHPRRNIVTRALGSAPTVNSDHWLLPAVGGDRFLICSDGLTGELPDEVILPLLTVGGPQQAAEALVAAANDAGGRDNVTAVVVDIVSGHGGTDETPTVVDQPAAWPSVTPTVIDQPAVWPGGRGGPGGWNGQAGADRPSAHDGRGGPASGGAGGPGGWHTRPPTVGLGGSNPRPPAASSGEWNAQSPAPNSGGWNVQPPAGGPGGSNGQAGPGAPGGWSGQAGPGAPGGWSGRPGQAGPGAADGWNGQRGAGGPGGFDDGGWGRPGGTGGYRAQPPGPPGEQGPPEDVGLRGLGLIGPDGDDGGFGRGDW